MDTEEPAAASVSKSKDSSTADSSAEASSVEPKKRYTLVLLAQKKSQKVSNVSYPKQPKIGDLMGELYIPKLNAKLPIYHGTNEDELEKASVILREACCLVKTTILFYQDIAIRFS